MIDLHLHSTYSDGSCTPAEVIELAVEAGVAAAALTDHDTMDGVPEFIEAARGRIRVIPGVELSTEDEDHSIHILAYFQSPDTPFENVLRLLRDDRDARNAEMLRRLDALGVPVTHDEVKACAGIGVIARPHIADALVRRGHVPNHASAFDRWIGDGKPAYVSRRALTPETCIQAVREAGGISVLAHPYLLAGALADQRARIEALKRAGLDGIEVFYPAHSPAQIRRYRTWARELDLAPSGGSDFHGAIRPGIKVGRGGGRFKVPAACLEELDRRLHARFSHLHPAKTGEK